MPPVASEPWGPWPHTFKKLDFGPTLFDVPRYRVTCTYHKACCNNSIAIHETIELCRNVTREILQVPSFSTGVKTETKTNGNAHFI